MSYEELYWSITGDSTEEFFELVDEVDLERPPDFDDHVMSVAAMSGDPAVVRELLDRGVDPDGGVAQGTTPLHTAIREDHTEVARLLVDGGATLDVRDGHGKVPLHLAVFQGHREAAESLVAAGADPTIEDDFGNSPVGMLRDWAAESDDPGAYAEWFDLFTEAHLAHEDSGEPDPTGLAAGHERVPVDGDVEDLPEWIWEHLVPPSGQADTVQGELLRAVEKLRDEAHRNGNANWNEHYERLVAFLETHLADPDRLDEDAVRAVREDLDRVSHPRKPCLEDDPYDRLVDRVVEFCEHHPELIEKPHDGALGI